MLGGSLLNSGQRRIKAAMAEARLAAEYRMEGGGNRSALPIASPGLLPSSPFPQNAMPVPDKLWLSAEKLELEGVYLLEVGGSRGGRGRECPALHCGSAVAAM